MMPKLPKPEKFWKLASECRYDSRLLARRLGITPRHLQRLFKAQLQCPPQQWLREQRMCRAREMLLTADSVKEVAHELGFSSASQFSRDYKSWFGQQPRNERRCRSGSVEAAMGGPANGRSAATLQCLLGMTAIDS